MADSWGQLAPKTPTTLGLFSLILEKHANGDTHYHFVAEINDQNGQKCQQVTGDINDYVAPGILVQLEVVIDDLYNKAESEMIP